MTIATILYQLGESTWAEELILKQLILWLQVLLLLGWVWASPTLTRSIHNFVSGSDSLPFRLLRLEDNLQWRRKSDSPAQSLSMWPSVRPPPSPCPLVEGVVKVCHSGDVWTHADSAPQGEHHPHNIERGHTAWAHHCHTFFCSWIEVCY